MTSSRRFFIEPTNLAVVSGLIASHSSLSASLSISLLVITRCLIFLSSRSHKCSIGLRSGDCGGKMNRSPSPNLTDQDNHIYSLSTYTPTS